MAAFLFHEPRYLSCSVKNRHHDIHESFNINVIEIYNLSPILSDLVLLFASSATRNLSVVFVALYIHEGHIMENEVVGDVLIGALFCGLMINSGRSTESLENLGLLIAKKETPPEIMNLLADTGRQASGGFAEDFIRLKRFERLGKDLGIMLK